MWTLLVSSAAEHRRLLLIDFQAGEHHVAGRIAIFGLQGFWDTIAAYESANSEFDVLSTDEVVDAAERHFADSKNRMRSLEAGDNFSAFEQFIILDALRSAKERDSIL